MPEPQRISGRKFSRTCLVRGMEDEGRQAIVVRKRDHSRVAGIGENGLTTSRSMRVATDRLFDVQDVNPSLTNPDAPVDAAIGEKGGVTIPVEYRRRFGLRAGSRVLIEPREDGLLIRPAEVKPRSIGPGWTLGSLMDGVKPENIHGEVEAGPPVGSEAL